MNKTGLKNYAIEARVELLEKVELQALKLGITAESIQKANVESSDAVFIDGKQLSDTERRQRNKLIARINEIGFDRVIEETAYTWFNRFVALRYMEANDYLPTKVRVLSSNSESAEPDMMKEALSLDLDLDKEKVYDLKMNNKTDELFKYLIKVHCNDLNRYMPFMFETIEAYTEILFPEGLLGTNSFVRKMTNIDVIPEIDWEQIEIIGWLYQYYNTEMNEIVYDGNMSKGRVPKELLPAATQLFTPDWAVKYMVENSLGSLWLESHENDEIKKNWEYYLDKDGINTSSNEQIELTQTKNNQLSPEDIKVFDPCMGSGHILVYAFDVLMQIYESCGYSQRDAAKLIIQKNLYGLEIDDRAYQLACFAVVMKARRYNRRILNEGIELNLSAIVESNVVNNFDLNSFESRLNQKHVETFNHLITVFKDAKEYGSILNVDLMDYESLQDALLSISNSEITDLFSAQLIYEIIEIMPKLIKQAKIMTQKYEVVVTNPPYLESARMSPLLDQYVKSYYPDTKADLSMVMYQKSINSYSVRSGYISFINTSSWMFAKSFENFREETLDTIEITTLVDFGTELFDGKIGHNPIVAWINRNSIPQTNMLAIRLVDFCYSRRDEKKLEYFNAENRHYSNQKNFKNISGSPIAYWVSDNFFEMFNKTTPVGEVAAPKAGLTTGDNTIFQRNWYELNFSDIGFNYNSIQETEDGKHRWFPCNSGGSFRKWYGNNEVVVDWEFNGEKIRNFKDQNGKLRSRPQNTQYFFKEGLTWTKISLGKFGVRYKDTGYIFDDTGRSAFTEDPDENLLIIGLFCSKVAFEVLKIISPAMSFTNGDIYKIPYSREVVIHNREAIVELVKENINISKYDWDSFEVSWDFEQHPLLKHKVESNKISVAFERWSKDTESQFNKLKDNEEELNRVFIELYDLQDDLNPVVADNDVTIRKADLVREVKSFISYVVGCSLGRYSIDEEGLIYAGGEFNSSRYKTISADEDNILPILPGAYFEDDIVTQFVDFVRATFSEKALEENLDFVADAIGRRKNETAIEALRRYFLNDFYKDHVRVYKKRPIYWLFTSGKEKAFNCLIYMHRYDKTTLSRIRIDYLHEVQTRLDAEKNDLLEVINGDSTIREINSAKRELKSLDRKIDELKAYDEQLHHMADMQIEIDLDDGVKVNYEKFKGLVAKI